MPFNGITDSPADGFTIQSTGVYEINLSTVFTALNTSTVSFSIRRNGTISAAGTFSKAVNGSEANSITGSLLEQLTANDIIDLAVSCTTPNNISFGINAAIYMTLKRIG